VAPFVAAVQRLKALLAKIRAAGITLRYLDLGGGLGITYSQEKPPSPAEYASAVIEALQGENLTLILEPGRVVAGNAAVLLIKVLYDKITPEKRFIVTDGAMNDLIRPSLYGSRHTILPVKETKIAPVKVNVVGPICESGDFLAKDRALAPVEALELLAVKSAGAYGFSMSSNYNSRPRAAEVLVTGGQYRIIRSRESFEDLIRGESL
jgi:diaminopimelate decarboxylase